ncbi:sedlin-domain-containing protein [Naegleria gruberi]|uniref:Sedlin-domain-containing protein n=1 Tax=Naegleria gruberi TaxID=5762 RepID=D2V3D1_NAEGR|nr:sedlin-domain-containing protein [Naegleria gruberi]EFC48616.1 sedlin-domain-containing protein [Naegleria gruberi]|eukprot:XP_002681360.1 sedlin-domain-containing protein [Naegleria gruberi strain NEG-M]
MPTNAYFTIVAKDCPIYELEISTSKKTDQSQLKQFVLHASLDAVEELQWTTNALFLKSVDRFNEFNIYGFVTGGNIRFLLLFENDKKNDDQTIKSFFSDVFELYIKIQMNPFYELYTPITSHDFDTRVKQLANKYIS